MSVEKPKLAQILGGIALLLAGICFALGTLFVSLLPPDSSRTTSQNPFAWIFASMFFIVFIELSLSWLKKAVAIRDSQVKYNARNLWATIALIHQFTGIFGSLMAILIFLAIFGITCYFSVLMFSQNRMTPSMPFFVQASVYGVYLLTRRPLMAALGKIGGSIDKQARRGLATYQLTPDGIVIDLNVTNLQNPSQRYLVQIGFGEIDEIRSLSYLEANTFKEYRVGPNVSLQWQQARDLYNYFKGNIPRPTVYFQVSSMGTTILLRGLNLFYLLTFDTDDASDLINAHKAFKMRT